MTQAVLEICHVVKTYPGVRALSGVSLECHPGEVHALVGENGSGKSTLIKIASGAVVADSGEVRICGNVLNRPSPLAAKQHGLLTSYQDTALVEDFTVAENVLLSFDGVGTVPSRRDLRRIDELLGPYDLPFSTRDQVLGLSPGARQLLETVRALLHDPKVLVLDEPTASLDMATADRLEDLVVAAARRGTAVLYVSHRLGEVQRIADRLTVLRDGVVCHSEAGSDWRPEEIVELMVGAPTELTFPPKPDATPRPFFSIENYSGRGFQGIDLRVGEGEVVGVAGAEGNGQREMLRALIGVRKGRGTMIIAGREASIRSPLQALKHGVVFQSGDRAREALFADMAVMENSTLMLGNELGPAGLRLRSKQTALFQRAARQLSVVSSGPDQPIGQMSGGNQQKAVLARSVLCNSRLVIIDEPTQGVDARSRIDIYRTIRAQAAEGASVLVNSSDSGELAGLCDRVYVMARGRIVKVLEDAEVTEQNIVHSFVADPSYRPAPKAKAGQLQQERPPPRRLLTPAAATWLPLSIVLLLTVAVGGLAAARSSAFLTTTNINSLLGAAAPLAIVALAQQYALLRGAFDISIGATISLTVVILSFFASGSGFINVVPGLLVSLVVGLAIGAFNYVLVRQFLVNPLIATIATLGIVSGIAILMRPVAGGIIGAGLTDPIGYSFGAVPVIFVIVAVAAVFAEIWRTRTMSGLRAQAVGRAPESARRIGISLERAFLVGFIIVALGAVLAGAVTAANVGVGANDAGTAYTLTTFTACFLAGASLSGGRGSFVGTLIGALFLSMLVNVSPLLNLSDAFAEIATGALTILAVAAFGLSSRLGSPRPTGSGLDDSSTRHFQPAAEPSAARLPVGAAENVRKEEE